MCLPYERLNRVTIPVPEEVFIVHARVVVYNSVIAQHDGPKCAQGACIRFVGSKIHERGRQIWLMMTTGADTTAVRAR